MRASWPSGCLALLVACCHAGPLAAQPVEPGREGALADILRPVPGQSVCFTRSYDAAHLKAHPAQRVTGLTLRLSYHRHDPDANFPAGQRNYYFAAAASLRGGTRRLVSSGECGADARGIRCTVECDGGGFALKREDAGSLLLDLTTYGRLRLSRSCDEEDSTELSAGADDRLFRLRPAAASVCRGLAGD